MKEQRVEQPARRESEPERIFNVTVIGAACSGKSTLLRSLRDRGFTVRQKPDNPVFPLFLENPRKYAYRNQLHEMTQLMELEVLDAKQSGLTDPHFRESGVLATAVYTNYLYDQGLMTDEQYQHLDWLYKHHLASFPPPDLIVYLYASDDIIRARAVKRDGLVAHDPQALQPYWEKLLADLESRGFPVLRINTGVRPVGETEEIIFNEIEEVKKKNKDLGPKGRPLQFRDVSSNLRFAKRD